MASMKSTYNETFTGHRNLTIRKCLKPVAVQLLTAKTNMLMVVLLFRVSPWYAVGLLFRVSPWYAVGL
jgi:hypothetical protein